MRKFLLIASAVAVSMSVAMAQSNYSTLSEDEDLSEGCLYVTLGEVTPTEGWGDTPMPEVRDVRVEGYDGYVIFRAFAGVEGYDMKVAFGEDDTVLAVTPIENGVEGATKTSGYVTVNTGREDFTFVKPYLGKGYCYGATHPEDGSGYYITYAYLESTWAYFNIVWPQGDGTKPQWDNPFEGETTLLYSAVARTEEASGWGASAFPEVENIKVDVYDKYIYIHALGGVEGYDAMVAYNADQDVLSMISVVDGEASDPCKSYIYLPTGREDYPTIQAYNDYSYAGSFEDNSGYACLAAYIYSGSGKYAWSYYNIVWEGDSSTTGVENVSVTASIDNKRYNVLGQEVDCNYKGLVIMNGKKFLVK